MNTINEVLNKGCDINFKDYDNRTALHIACAEGHIEVIKLLIKNNIIIQKDRWNNTPINDIPKDKQNEIKEMLTF